MSRFIKTSSTKDSRRTREKAPRKAGKSKLTRHAVSGRLVSTKARGGRKSRDPLFDIDSIAVDTGIRDLAESTCRPKAYK
jgi:hypothetical protein